MVGLWHGLHNMYPKAWDVQRTDAFSSNSPTAFYVLDVLIITTREYTASRTAIYEAMIHSKYHIRGSKTSTIQYNIRIVITFRLLGGGLQIVYCSIFHHCWMVE